MKLGDPFRRNREVHALASGDLQSCHTDHLTLHVYYRTAARARRNRRSDLNDAAKAGNVSHGRNNSIGDTAFQTKWIANHHYAFAFLRRRAVEGKRARQVRWRVDFQQSEIAFGVHGNYALNLISIARIQV